MKRNNVFEAVMTNTDIQNSIAALGSGIPTLMLETSFTVFDPLDREVKDMVETDDELLDRYISVATPLCIYAEMLHYGAVENYGAGLFDAIPEYMDDVEEMHSFVLQFEELWDENVERIYKTLRSRKAA